MLHTAQVREVAEQIEAACRRDGLGLALDQRASGAYGSLSVNVTGPAERVNALRSSLGEDHPALAYGAPRARTWSRRFWRPVHYPIMLVPLRLESRQPTNASQGRC